MDSHIIDRIVNRLKEINSDKVILFGSYAWGGPHEDSDLDIIVVTNEDIMPKNYNEKMEIGHDGLLLVVGWWFFLTLPDSLSCPLFIYMVMVHFEFEFTCIIVKPRYPYILIESNSFSSNV